MYWHPASARAAVLRLDLRTHTVRSVAPPLPLLESEGSPTADDMEDCTNTVTENCPDTSGQKQQLLHHALQPPDGEDWALIGERGLVTEHSSAPTGAMIKLQQSSRRQP